MKRLIELLHSEGCSCVIESQGEIRAFRQRGVADLYDLYQNERDFMQTAQLADKVIGKGAPALIAFGIAVPVIINRSQTGRCPLESLCAELDTAEEIYPIIEKFVAQIRTTNNLEK